MSKIRLIFGLLLILVSLTSCRPRKVLSRSEMTDVLYDIHLTDVLLNQGTIYQNSSWTHGLNPDDFADMAYQSVLRKHGIDEKTFYISVSYYSKKLNLYEKIYADVDKRLQDYIDEIKNRKYDVPTVAQVLAGLKMDTLELQKRYRYALYIPDTVPVRRLFLSADSLPSYAAWYTRQWLHKPDKGFAAFSMVSHIRRIILVESPAVKDSVLLADTLSGNTKVVMHSDASGNVTKEIVATQARKMPPRNFRKNEKENELQGRFRERLNEKKQADR
ncbi:MAG: DUF4296 domain-containing protein [Bacteroidales bacterium]|nr:DUF4296 domain-containing protein [Bacteroidales bacterium]MDD4712019.1 DUF4296 domain-containing protein [Bacteroidales bacterium]